MYSFERAQARCWEIFREEYPGYVGQDDRYLSRVRSLLHDRSRVLDAGCGWNAPFASQIADTAAEVIGLDLGIEPTPLAPNVRTLVGDLSRMPFEDRSFDLVMSRSVLEHLPEPASVFGEISRVLKPGGAFVFLIPNAWDYVSVVSWMVPNALHGLIVQAIQGRSPRDTFPAHYLANTIPALRRLCRDAGLDLVESTFLTQYPSYLMFSPTAFRLGVRYQRLVERHQKLQWLGNWILGTAVKSSS